MDAPMDNGTSAHQPPAFAQQPTLAQPLGTQYLGSTSNNAGGESRPASNAHLPTSTSW